MNKNKQTKKKTKNKKSLNSVPLKFGLHNNVTLLTQEVQSNLDIQYTWYWKTITWGYAIKMSIIQAIKGTQTRTPKILNIIAVLGTLMSSLTCMIMNFGSNAKSVMLRLGN